MNAADASCPRCGGAFHCGVNDPLPCACGQFTLSPACTQMLRSQYDRCVCMACLAQLQQTAPVADIKKPAQP
ncbi:MAG: cysteine-rich CWC family protein [Rhizobacter sp.]|nr:cysteine-rich CWC family protein [Rhizobacter sp.]